MMSVAILTSSMLRAVQLEISPVRKMGCAASNFRKENPQSVCMHQTSEREYDDGTWRGGTGEGGLLYLDWNSEMFCASHGK